MSELVCKFCEDEFCVNDQCPMRGDYCPVPATPGVCKHEVRVEVKNRITPRECLRKAIDDPELDSFVIYKSFTNLLAENGYEIVETDNKSVNNDRKFVPGQCVNQFDIANSHDWVFDRKINGHGIHEHVVWVTRDRKLRVTFDDRSEEGVVTLNLFAGKTVNLADIEKSDAWTLKSFASNTFDTSCSYASKDDQYVVEFAHQAATGTVKSQYYPGMSVHVGRIGESPYWEFAGSSHDLVDIYATKDKSLFVAFDRNSDWGVIKRSLTDLLM